MDQYIVITYHHEGVLVRNAEGVLTYVNGRVDDLLKMDADLVNLCDLETLFKGYGYEKCRQMLWLKPNEADLEVGLRLLSKDSDILQMVEAALGNGNKIDIYFDDCIAISEILSPSSEEASDDDDDDDDGLECDSGDDERVSGDSFGSGDDHNDEVSGKGNGMSSDSYNNVEDEPYKPPPPGFEDQTEDEEEDDCIIQKTEKRRLRKRRKKRMLGSRLGRKIWKRRTIKCHLKRMGMDILLKS